MNKFQDILLFLLKCLYLMLPALLANAAPVLFIKINFLNYPIDFKKTFRNKRILGTNKTFRGLFFGILIAMIITYIQALLFDYSLFFKSISIIHYKYPLLLGFLTGFGVIFGDSIESFVKRQFNIKPGGKFFPWDQIDFFIGYLLFTSIMISLTLKTIIFLLIVIPIIHVFFNHLWYWLGLKKTKW